MVLRGTSALALVSTVGTMGLVGRFAVNGHSLFPRMRVATAAVTEAGGEPSTAKPTPAPSTVASQPAPAPAQQVAALSAAPAIAPTTNAIKPSSSVAVPVVPVVPQGQTALADSLLATRADSVVTVWFDRTMVRTRNPVKFERLVRTTLPAVYGAIADSALKHIPEGALAQQGDLINDLPTRGLHIPVAPGWEFALFPITRPGHDGPLVTQYRVSVIRG